MARKASRTVMQAPPSVLSKQLGLTKIAQRANRSRVRHRVRKVDRCQMIAAASHPSRVCGGLAEYTGPEDQSGP